MTFLDVFDAAHLNIWAKAHANGITLTMRGGVSPEKNGETNGYFDGENLVVYYGQKVATVNNLLTLLHESGHMDQMLEKSPYWTNCDISGYDVSEIIELWIDERISLNPSSRNDYFYRLVECEIDADRRTVQKIIKYGIHRFTSVTDYIRIANAYQMEYWFAKDNRRWLPANKRPYENEKILSLMPASPFKNARESSLFYFTNDTVGDAIVKELL